VPLLLREAIIVAAAELGSDGNGEQGLVGYLKMLGTKHPSAFANLLGRLLPAELAATLIDDDEPMSVTLSVDEVRARLARRGINVDTIFDPPAIIDGLPTTRGGGKPN
jgi:hypothetical protein